MYVDFASMSKEKIKRLNDFELKYTQNTDEIRLSMSRYLQRILISKAIL
jgi:hypothetical protein